MLDSLYIKGFKLFEELNVPELSRLNLFVGNNNTGKSCLLEAVRLFASEASPAVIRDVIHTRDGDWETNLRNRSEVDDNYPSDAVSPMWSLFHDFQALDPSLMIEIGTGDEERRLRLSIDFYKRDDDLSRWVLVDPENDSIEVADEMLEVFVGFERTRLLRLENLFGRRGLLGRIPSPVDDRPKTKIISVGTDGIKRQEVGYLWDRINKTPFEDKVLSCLRLIDHRVEGVALVGNSERTVVLRLAGVSERVPLKALGDGMTRLLHIGLAMANAEDGIVLIDEFENGLYWGVQAELWPVVFEMAEAFNVQVFATSHSGDCIKGFERAWEKRPDLGAMYRLERKGSSVKAFSLPIVNLSDALESLVEVR